MSPDYVLYEMSWQNLILYSSALPQYDDEKVDDGVKDIDWDKFDACNTENYQDLPQDVY